MSPRDTLEKSVDAVARLSESGRFGNVLCLIMVSMCFYLAMTGLSMWQENAKAQTVVMKETLSRVLEVQKQQADGVVLIANTISKNKD